jgi:hypothetical protein
MLLSEENERLRAELERMKSLAASLLGGPSIGASQDQHTLQLGGRFSGSSPANPLTSIAQGPLSSFHLTLSQPSVEDFVGLSNANRRRDLPSYTGSSDATVPLSSYSLPRAGSLQDTGQLHRALQNSSLDKGSNQTLPQLSSRTDFPVLLSSGQSHEQHAVLGNRSFDLENMRNFAGNFGSSASQTPQPMSPLLPMGVLGGGESMRNLLENTKWTIAFLRFGNGDSLDPPLKTSAKFHKHNIPFQRALCTCSRLIAEVWVKLEKVRSIGHTPEGGT